MENVVNRATTVAAGTSTTNTTTTSSSSSISAPHVKIFSAPASPAAASTTPVSPPASPAMMNQSSENLRAVSPTPASGVGGAAVVVNSSPTASGNYSPYMLCSTPIKSQNALAYLHQQLQQTPDCDTKRQNGLLLHTLREKLLTPGSGSISLNELHALRSNNDASSHCAATATTTATAKPLHVIKDRYLVSSHRYQMSAAQAAKTPASYRHLIDMTSAHLRCTDIFTEKQYLCKIINEPLYKVQRAYYQLLHDDTEGSESTIYGHSLIRGVHDIVPMNEQRTYVIIAAPPMPEMLEETTTASEVSEETNNMTEAMDIEADNNNSDVGATPLSSTPITNNNNNDVDYFYEDLHTYIRNKRRLCEAEARALFHQICQTVQVCHRNGVILRDLKLKRFYFIDEARTKLQYESLEGSMILDDPADDTLRDKIGCPLYTAPELLCPNTTYRGKPADMWSLGVLLYTMLVGQYPFYEKGNCSLITVIRHCQVQIPSMLTRSVRWLLLALLRKNHEERMTADQIFLTPWLREQRPYYMCIPANVSIDANEDGIGGGGDDEEEMATTTTEEEQQQQENEYENDGNGDDDDDDDVEDDEEAAHKQEAKLMQKYHEQPTASSSSSSIYQMHYFASDAYDDDGDEDDDDDDDSVDYDEDEMNAENVGLNATTTLTTTPFANSDTHRHVQNTRTSRESLAASSNGCSTSSAAVPLDYTCASLQFNCSNTTTQQQQQQQQQETTSSSSSSDVDMC